MSFELMMKILGAGANLTIERAMPSDEMEELARIAVITGSQITFKESCDDDVYLKVAAKGKSHVTFVSK
jgi:hypothetical protein